MRLAIDVGKAASCDGMAAWVRGLVGALAGGAGAQAGDRVVLVDLLRERPEEVAGAFGSAPASSFENRIADAPATALRDADVLLATTWSVPAAWRGPLAFVAYDLTFLSHPDCHTVDNRLHCLEGCLRAALAGATFVAISEATAAEVKRRLDVPIERLLVAYPAAAPIFRPRAAADVAARIASRFQLAPGYVLAVGSLEPRKNLARLLAAHAQLDARVRQARPLVVVGGGGWRNGELEQALAAASADGAVRRLGQVADDDLVDLYCGAALFAYPSLAEGFGLPVLEAMACGTPVLSSSGSSLPEVAGDAALLIAPEDVSAIRDGLVWLLADDGERARLATAGAARAARFSWDDAAARILARCRALAAGPP